MFGSPETQPGGQEIMHASDITVQFYGAPHRTPADMEKEPTSMTFRMKGFKNKFCATGRKADVTIRFDENYGVDVSAEVAALAKFYRIVQNAKGEAWEGGYVFYQGEKLMLDTTSGPKPIGSEANLVKRLDDDPDLRATLEMEVRLAIANEGRLVIPASEETESIVE